MNLFLTPFKGHRHQSNERKEQVLLYHIRNIDEGYYAFQTTRVIFSFLFDIDRYLTNLQTSLLILSTLEILLSSMEMIKVRPLFIVQIKPLPLH